MLLGKLNAVYHSGQHDFVPLPDGELSAAFIPPLRAKNRRNHLPPPRDDHSVYWAAGRAGTESGESLGRLLGQVVLTECGCCRAGDLAMSWFAAL